MNNLKKSAFFLALTSSLTAFGFTGTVDCRTVYENDRISYAGENSGMKMGTVHFQLTNDSLNQTHSFTWFGSTSSDVYKGELTKEIESDEWVDQFSIRSWGTRISLNTKPSSSGAYSGSIDSEKLEASILCTPIN